ncbi:MAG: rRNA maturation RNase YbeY [Betaproteobacteria bacterium]
MALVVAVQGHGRFDRLPARSTLVRWIRAAVEHDAELTLRFVGAAEARRLNREFRGKDYATNVLTFDYEHAPVVRADIVLCVPVVRREARAQRKPFREHLAHLVVHGALHAQGHDHDRAVRARTMEALEVRILAGLGIGDPYREGGFADG